MSNSLQAHGLYVACQAPLSMGFPRQEYWSGLLSSPPGDLPNLGIELGFPVLQADSLALSHLGHPQSECRVMKTVRGKRNQKYRAQELSDGTKAPKKG